MATESKTEEKDVDDIKDIGYIQVNKSFRKSPYIYQKKKYDDEPEPFITPSKYKNV